MSNPRSNQPIRLPATTRRDAPYRTPPTRYICSIDRSKIDPSLENKDYDTCDRTHVRVSPYLVCEIAEDAPLSVRCLEWLGSSRLYRIATKRHRPNDRSKSDDDASSLLTYETFIRENRLSTMRDRFGRPRNGGKSYASDNNNDTTTLQLPHVKSIIVCEYDYLTCAALVVLRDTRLRFRDNYSREMNRRTKESLRLEREATDERDDIAQQLRELESERMRARASLDEAKRTEETLSNENAALSTLLMNSTVELEMQSKLFLQKINDDLENALTTNPKLCALRTSVRDVTAKRDAVRDEIKSRTADACRILNKMFHTNIDENSDDCEATIAERYDEFMRVIESCEESISTTPNIDMDSLDELLRACEPLRDLRSIAMLDSVRQNYRVQLDRRERLTNTIARNAAVPLNEYAAKMNEYLSLLNCLETVTATNFTIGTNDSEFDTPRDGAMLHAYPDSSYLRRLVSIAMGATKDERMVNYLRRHGRFKPLTESTRWTSPSRSAKKAMFANRCSAVFHAVLKTCASFKRKNDVGTNCPQLKRDSLIEVLYDRKGEDVEPVTANMDNSDATVLQYVNWPIGIPIPEKRGLAFVAMVASCPEDLLIL